MAKEKTWPQKLIVTPYAPYFYSAIGGMDSVSPTQGDSVTVWFALISSQTALLFTFLDRRCGSLQMCPSEEKTTEENLKYRRILLNPFFIK